MMKSRLYLKRLEAPPVTILEHLVQCFPQVPPSAWVQRVLRGLVTIADGTTVLPDSPYRHGVTVLYEKEVPLEPLPVETDSVVYRDALILVADKPHGIPVTPAGSYVERSLLARLQRSAGMPALAPMHRLDRDTAGLVLFAIRPEVREQYHQLFADGKIHREYFAVANLTDEPKKRQWRVENRIERGEPWYRQRTGNGPINAITEIELIAVENDRGIFRLMPKTGRKHQLRLHMASIGFPIVGDPLYSCTGIEPGGPPLQLLAHRLEFVDPVSGTTRSFASARSLLCFPNRTSTYQSGK